MKRRRRKKSNSWFIGALNHFSTTCNNYTSLPLIKSQRSTCFTAGFLGCLSLSLSLSGLFLPLVFPPKMPATWLNICVSHPSLREGCFGFSYITSKYQRLTALREFGVDNHPSQNLARLLFFLTLSLITDILPIKNNLTALPSLRFFCTDPQATIRYRELFLHWQIERLLLHRKKSIRYFSQFMIEIFYNYDWKKWSTSNFRRSNLNHLWRVHLSTDSLNFVFFGKVLTKRLWPIKLLKILQHVRAIL